MSNKNTALAESAQALFCALAEYLDIRNKKLNVYFDAKGSIDTYVKFKLNWESKFKKDYENIETIYDRFTSAGEKQKIIPLKDIETFLINDQSWYISSCLIGQKLVEDIGNVSIGFKNKKPKTSEIWFYRGDKEVMNNIKILFDEANKTQRNFKKVDNKIGIPFGDINKWCPADIYFATTLAKKIINDKTSNKTGLTFDALNKMVSNLITSGDLLPISLKKQTSSVHIECVNFNKSSEQKLLDQIEYNSYTWKFRDMKIFMTTLKSDKDYILLRHDPSVETLRAEILIKGMEAKSGGLGFEQLIQIIALIDDKLSNSIKSKFDNANKQFKKDKKPIRDQFENAVKSFKINIKSEVKKDKEKIKEIRQNLMYDDKVGKLSEKVTDSVFPTVVKFLKNKESADSFVRLVYQYATSRSVKSSKFVIAK